MQQIKHVDEYAVFVAICGKTPDWYDGIQYKKVAPKWSWWKKWHDDYAGRYESKEAKNQYVKYYESTVLAGLSRKDVLLDVNAFSNGNNIYMLCYETPDKFCHRHLLADWLNDELKDNEKIIEWENMNESKE